MLGGECVHTPQSPLTLACHSCKSSIDVRPANLTELMNLHPFQERSSGGEYTGMACAAQSPHCCPSTTVRVPKQHGYLPARTAFIDEVKMIVDSHSQSGSLYCIREDEVAVLQHLVARTNSELGAIGRDLKAVVGQERCLRALLAARNEDLRRAAADRAALEQRLEQVYPSPPHLNPKYFHFQP